MSVLHKLLVASGSAALLTISSWSLADDVPVSVCTQYLSSTDSAFYAMVSSNGTTASTVAQTLDACSSANVCDQINSVTSCAETLANRFFISEYFAAINGNGASSGSVSAAAVPPVSATPSTPNANSVANTTAPKNKSSKSDSSVHWF